MNKDKFEDSIAKLSSIILRGNIDEMSDLVSQRKALVFVRRVASAYELEQRLMKKFEQEYVLPRLQRINDNNAYKNKDLGQLIKRFREKKNEIILPHVYKVVYEREMS